MAVRHIIGNFVRSKYSNILILPMVLIEVVILYHLFMSSDVWVPEKPLSNFEKQVWTFYTASYDNPATDKTWGHWSIRKNSFGDAVNKPPFEIPSYNFPQMGLYSSHNKFVIKKHMRMLARHGIDGVIVNWIPPQQDKKFVDESVKIIFKQAKKIGVSVALQIMNYNDRDNETLNRDINYIRSNYAYNEIYLKFDGKPIIFIDDPHDCDGMQVVIPKQERDIFFLGRVNEKNHINLALEDGFRGVYTVGSPEPGDWKPVQQDWAKLHEDCVSRGLLFIPTVYPGYTRKLSAFNSYTQGRENGDFYKRTFTSAANCGSSLIIINSFNDWNEGTNIEPIVAKPDFMPNSVTWSDNGDPEFYMDLTKELIADFKKKKGN